jgi:hypothetical protein
MNPLLIVVLLLGLASPLGAQPFGVFQSPSQPNPRSAPLNQGVSSELRLAAGYCQVHTFAKKPQKLCWKRIKEALLRANVISSYPQSSYAYQAGDELVARYGFRKIAVLSPYDAPVGSILVYRDNGEGGGFGHAEFRTPHGFTSDYTSPYPCKFKLTGVYIK